MKIAEELSSGCCLKQEEEEIVQMEKAGMASKDVKLQVGGMGRRQIDR